MAIGEQVVYGSPVAPIHGAGEPTEAASDVSRCPMCESLAIALTDRASMLHDVSKSSYVCFACLQPFAIVRASPGRTEG
jgi:hypothetical protein